MSTTIWIQLLGVIFALIMLYFTFLKFKRKELNIVELWSWLLLWILFMFVAIIPSILDPVIVPLKFHRRLDFFVVFGFFVLLSMGFYNYIVTRNLQKKVELILVDRAFKNVEKKNKEE